MNKSDSRIYIGNLPQDVRTKDIEDLFYKYGKIRYIDLKNRKGPPFAFVEYEDPLDAEDAIDGRDGYNFDGHRLRVEFQKGSRGGGGGGSSRGGPGAGAGRGPPTRRSEYRCIISGLPSTGSWQDLKDHMREAGNVCYADVFKDGTGVVEFTRADDMKYAIKHLDDTKFRSHEGESSYIRVRADSSKSRRRSVSRSRSRTRSRSVSPRRHGRGSPSYSPADRSAGGSKRTRHRDSRSRSRSSRSRSRTRSKSPRTRRNRSRSPRSRSRSTSRTRAAATKRSRTASPVAESKQVEKSANGDNGTNDENGMDDVDAKLDDAEVVAHVGDEDNEDEASGAPVVDEPTAHDDSGTNGGESAENGGDDANAMSQSN